MNAIEVEALLIRHQAAMSQLRGGGGGLELLTMVVAPTPALREASLIAARERGPGKMALALARTDGGQVSAPERKAITWGADSRSRQAA